MPESATTFLMFEGSAEAAIRLYESIFDDLEVIALKRHGPEGGENEGTLKKANGTMFRSLRRRK